MLFSLLINDDDDWKLGRAYETLKDESQRRDYDVIYPGLRRRWASQDTQTQTPNHPPPTSTPQAESLSDAAQIAALQKAKQERRARWQTRKNAFESSIFEIQRDLRRLGQEIENLNGIAAAEAAEEAAWNTFGAWLLSPIWKKPTESEEKKARKDRERQERRIEKDMKERRVEVRKADLKTEQDRLEKAKREVDAADLNDDWRIRVIRARISTEEIRKRQEKEKLERERMANIWREMQQQQREADEATRKQQEKRAAEQRRQEEEEARIRRERFANFDFANGSTRRASPSTCRHDGWWPKVQGRTACPQCCQSWTYLLQCPGCQMKACPKCQAAIRRRNKARTSRPSFGFDDL